MTVHKYTKYAHLEALTLDEINMNRVESVVIRTTFLHENIHAITKLSSKDMMIEPGQGYLASREHFITAVEKLCAYMDDANFIRHEIVRWRDNDGVWHIHTGPIERHAKVGDKVFWHTNVDIAGRTFYGDRNDHGFIIRLYLDAAKTPCAEVAFLKHNENIPLRHLRYVDNPDIEVVL